MTMTYQIVGLVIFQLFDFQSIFAHTVRCSKTVSSPSTIHSHFILIITFFFSLVHLQGFMNCQENEMKKRFLPSSMLVQMGNIVLLHMLLHHYICIYIYCIKYDSIFWSRMAWVEYSTRTKRMRRKKKIFSAWLWTSYYVFECFGEMPHSKSVKIKRIQRIVKN